MDNLKKDKSILLKEFKYVNFRKWQEIIDNKEDTAKNIIEKFNETCFFYKYYGQEIKEKLFDIIDKIIFICYIKEKREPGINCFFFLFRIKKYYIFEKFRI